MIDTTTVLTAGGVALFLSSAGAARFYRKGKPLIERGCSLFLIIFGVRQALARP